MKAKSFYKNNKHNNMDSKEKENINNSTLYRKLFDLKTKLVKKQQRKKKKLP